MSTDQDISLKCFTHFSADVIFFYNEMPSSFFFHNILLVANLNFNEHKSGLRFRIGRGNRSSTKAAFYCSKISLCTFECSFIEATCDCFMRAAAALGVIHSYPIKFTAAYN